MIPVAAWLVATVIALVDVGQASDSEIACGAAEASTASLLQLGQASSLCNLRICEMCAC